MAANQPVFGIQARGLDDRDAPLYSLEEMAEDCYPTF